MTARPEPAHAAADALDALRQSKAFRPALVGFDGFIDSIIEVVDQRHDMSPRGYDRIKSIAQFALRIGAAAGKSTNVELVVKEDRFGGNGPLMAGAMGRLGMPVTYVGAVGRNDDPRALNPQYLELSNRCHEVIPIAPPAHTDALEFDDGKLMLGKPANVQSITWPMLVETLGLPTIRAKFEAAAIIGIVNWVMMGGVEGIWEGLSSDVLPGLSDRSSRRVLIDLADPAKRTDSDILRAVGLLRKMNALVPVVLGLNLAEGERMSKVLGVSVFEQRGMLPFGAVVETAARTLREKLELSCVVIHPREGAAAADANSSAWFDGPFTSTPKLSTGAGDHFNGGFAFAQIHGLPLDQCLAVGCGVSGAYVRDAKSPDLDRLISFLRDLPHSDRAPRTAERAG
jgi:sugar/nucleoside kinase (ribokinase family)